jgi:hypothetical protein
MMRMIMMVIIRQSILLWEDHFKANYDDDVNDDNDDDDKDYIRMRIFTDK